MKSVILSSIDRGSNTKLRRNENDHKFQIDADQALCIRRTSGMRPSEGPSQSYWAESIRWLARHCRRALATDRICEIIAMMILPCSGSLSVHYQ